MRFLLILLICLGWLLAGCATEQTAEQAFDAGNYAIAFRLFKPAAEAGDSEAQNYLGVHYYLGLGVARDLGRALEWYELAARQGHPGAQLNYGIMFHNAHGVAQDMVAAYQWYYAAWSQGNVRARYYMDALSGENRLSPNQMNFAQGRAREYIVNPVARAVRRDNDRQESGS